MARNVDLVSIIIDTPRRPKTLGNVDDFINSSHPRSINKLRNCMFEERDRNRVVVCVIKSIFVGKDLLIS